MKKPYFGTTVAFVTGLLILGASACRQAGTEVSGELIPPSKDGSASGMIQLNLPNEGRLGNGLFNEIVLNTRQNVAKVTSFGSDLRFDFLGWNGKDYSVLVKMADSKSAFQASEMLRDAQQLRYTVIINVSDKCDPLEKNVRGEDEELNQKRPLEYNQVVKINDELMTSTTMSPLIAYTCRIKKGEWSLFMLANKAAQSGGQK